MSSTHSTVAAAGLAANTDGTATATATAGSADSRCVMRDRSQKSLFAVTSYLLKVLHSRLRSLSYIYFQHSCLIPCLLSTAAICYLSTSSVYSLLLLSSPSFIRSRTHSSTHSSTHSLFVSLSRSHPFPAHLSNPELS
jgi:hypothetical protein